MKNRFSSYFCFIIIFSFFTSLTAQTIKGTITDKNKKLITVSNILIKKDSTNISEYTFSNDGNYEITLNKSYKRIIIEVDAYGYIKNHSIIENPIKGKVYVVNFELEADINQLDEIIIKAEKKPFLIKKDTVKYNVKSYLNGSEKKIQDVIKKLPGINVNENTGEIKYKGKSIETVLLEGDNLFGYNYSLGTKNINVDMVEQIQAIDNYSENPLLKNIENGDKVVLNLKLKKGKIDFSGNFDAGLGSFNDSNIASNTNLNILGITKNYKSFGVLAHNNIGINRSPFDYFSFNSNLEELKEKENFAEKIIPETRFSNFLSDDRVNINNQFFGNYNAIFNIGKKVKIKTNLYYLNDQIKSNQFIENQYFIDGSNFITNDNYFLNKKPKQYRGDLNIKFNASKTSLLEYDFRVRQEDIITKSSIESNNDNSFNSSLKSNDNYIKNKLLYTKKVSNKKALQLSVFQSTNEILQVYKITPLSLNLNPNGDIQKVNTEKNRIGSKITFLGASSNNKYSFSLGAISNKNIIKSELSNNINLANINNSENYLDYSKKLISQRGSYHFNFNKWSVSPSYSVDYLAQEIINYEKNTNTKKNNFTLAPSLKLRYRLDNISFLQGKISYTQDNKAEEYLFENEVLINNRTTISNTPNLDLQKTLSYGLFYFKNDLYNQLEINLGINYQEIENSFFTNTTVNEDVLNINYFFLPEKNNNLSMNFLISKYLSFIETNTKLSVDYSVSNYKNIINSSNLRDNRNKSSNIKLLFKTVFDGFINFKNELSFSKFNSKSENSNEFINETFTNSFNIILNPSKRVFLKLSSNYFLPNLSKKNESYNFLDASIRYRPKNKRFEFEFIVRNLSNENNFEQIQVIDFSTNIYRTNILPMYMFLNMTYTF
ncbi:MAG: hypothetical protein JXR05_16985 [Flavobacteriaceae bacterium]